MTMEITLPALGENIDSATVTKVFVKVGDTIQKDQPIMELDTEKASVDVPASSSGTVKEIRVKEGDVLNVGQVVLILEESGKSAGSTSPKAEPEQSVRCQAQANQKRNRKGETKPKKETATPISPQVEPIDDPIQTQPLETLPEPAQRGVPAAPKLRRMARELGIDIHAVAGTGPDGRITEEDVRNYAQIDHSQRQRS